MLWKAIKVLSDQTSCPKKRKLAQKLLKPLSAIQADKNLVGLAKRINDKVKAFDQLRIALRIAEPVSDAGLNGQGSPIHMNSVKHAVKTFRDQLDSGKDMLPRCEVIKLIEPIDRHRDDLFREPLQVTTPDGSPLTIYPQRNNIMEHFFRDCGRNERRRTGIDFSARRLTAMLPDTSLVCNLKDSVYLRILLGDCINLEERFSRIDSKMIRDSLAAARSTGKIFARPRKARKVLRHKAQRRITSLSQGSNRRLNGLKIRHNKLQTSPDLKFNY